MKKLIYFILLALFSCEYTKGGFYRQDINPEHLDDIVVYRSDKEGILLSVEFPDLFDYDTVEYDTIEYRRYKGSSRYKVIGKAGEPEILYRSFWLQVPLDARNISIDQITIKKIDIKYENANIYPIPEYVFEENEDNKPITSTYKFKINNEIYASKKVFPGYGAKILEEDIMHGLRLIKIAVPAMQYDLEDNSVEFAKSISIKINYLTNSVDNILDAIYVNKDPFHNVFKNNVVNYKYKNNIYLGNGNTGTGNTINSGSYMIIDTVEDLSNPDFAILNNFYPDYLVILAYEFRNSTNVLKWVEHRVEKGYNIALAYTDKIYEAYYNPNFGTESKSTIYKKFIKTVYKYWRQDLNIINLEYLLLIGDADYSYDNEPWFLDVNNEYAPYPMVGHLTDIIAVDNDNSYVFLEPGNSYLTDVMIGRLPAKNEIELGIMVDKIIYFENKPPKGINHYGTRVLWLSGDMGSWANPYEPSNQSTPTRNLLINNKIEIEQYDTNFLKNFNLFKYDTNTVINYLNNEGALFLTYAGHGYMATFDVWKGWDPDVIVDSSLNNYENMLALVLATACYTNAFNFAKNNFNGGFDIIDSVGETWIKHPYGGAVSYWGSTRAAFDTSFSNNEDFYRAVHQYNNHILGSAISEVNLYLSNQHRFRYNLLGDPSLNFSNHIKKSNKIDLSSESFNQFPSFFDYYKQEATNTITVKNNSDKIVSDFDIHIFELIDGELINNKVFYNNKIEPMDTISKEYTWYYNLESSKIILAWINYTQSIPELSKINNILNPIVKQYPIYVDSKAQNEFEYGTNLEPFKNFKQGIEHLIENDLVGEAYSINDSNLELKLKEGEYGIGETIKLDNRISIEGIDNNVVIYDAFILNGKNNHFKNIIFDAKHHSDNIFKVNYKSFFQNNVFKNSSMAAILFEDDRLYGSKLENNIFYDNSETLNFIHPTAFTKHSYSLINNTFTRNINNFNFSNITGIFKNVSITMLNNIVYNNGESIINGSYPNEQIILKMDYCNSDDEILNSNINYNYGQLGPQGNINFDPFFIKPQINNFYLQANSPSVDTGIDGEMYFDPDNTRNDMGAFGGPNAIIKAIKITSPFNGETLYVTPRPDGSLILSLKWRTINNLNQTYPIVKILVTHNKINRNANGTNVIVDFEGYVDNNGLYHLVLNNLNENKLYNLSVFVPDNSSIGETIVFKFFKNRTSIKDNR